MINQINSLKRKKLIKNIVKVSTVVFYVCLYFYVLQMKQTYDESSLFGGGLLTLIDVAPWSVAVAFFLCEIFAWKKALHKSDNRTIRFVRKIEIAIGIAFLLITVVCSIAAPFTSQPYNFENNILFGMCGEVGVPINMAAILMPICIVTDLVLFFRGRKRKLS